MQTTIEKKKRLRVEGAGWHAFQKKDWDNFLPEDLPEDELKQICVRLGVISEFNYVKKGGLWIGEGIAAEVLDAYQKSPEMRDIFPTLLDKLMALIGKVLTYRVLSISHDPSKPVMKKEITKEEQYAQAVATFGFYGLFEEIARLNHKTEAIKVFDVINSQGEFKDEYAEPLLQMLREFREIDESVAKDTETEVLLAMNKDKKSKAKQRGSG
ncbi:MAG: hypothetical protein JRN15_11000 [Nitrososphaerota archaeon]|nr:hypothetical protein [Nitrososphaerota archaeon]